MLAVETYFLSFGGAVPGGIQCRNAGPGRTARPGRTGLQRRRRGGGRGQQPGRSRRLQHGPPAESGGPLPAIRTLQAGKGRSQDQVETGQCEYDPG